MVNVDHHYHLRVVMAVEELEQFHYHTLVSEKHVLYLMKAHHVSYKVQMELEFPMLIICCLYQHLVRTLVCNVTICMCVLIQYCIV